MKRLKNFFKESQGGFTLIELLIVLALIAILTAVLVVPNLSGILPRGRIVATSWDAKTALQESLEYFRADLNGALPRKNGSDNNYFTVLFTGINNDGTPMAGVVMKNKQGVDQSQAGVLAVASVPLNLRDNVYYHLITNGRNYPAREEGLNSRFFGWSSDSYLKITGPLLDQWGNSYLIAFRDLSGNKVRIFILSAGPDMILDTDFMTGDAVNENDIGVTWIARL